MPKVSPIQTSFSAGEFSPLVYGRSDADRYRTALAKCLNYIPTIQGALTRRPGSYYVAEVRDSSKQTRLIPFEFSTTQAYILEFSDQKIRFYRDQASITITGQNITAITKANPAVVTYSGSDTYANGDKVLIIDVVGMVQVNNREFTVANVNTGANTFELSGVNSTNYTTYVSGGTINEVYEITSPYLEDDLFQLKYTQSADVLYIVHPAYAPRKLSRTAHTEWTLTTIDFQDGPYLEISDSGATLTPSAATGAGITLTAGASRTITGAANNGSGLIRITSVAHGFVTGDRVYIAGVTGTTEANGTWIVTKIDADNFDLQASTFANAYVANGTARPGVFYSTDVGRLVRLKEGSVWGWVTITVFINASLVSADVESTLTNTNAKATWRLGLWSETTSYPGSVVFHEDRLVFAGSDDAPQRFDGSNTSDYENFAPSGTDGTVVSSNAISFSLNANTVNRIRWMGSDEKGLIAGSVGGEWIIRPSSQSEAITPTNVSAKQSTFWGSADLQPVQVGKGAVFVQRSGKKVRDIQYYFDVDGFRAEELSLLSEHLVSSGITQIAYQREPQSIVWMVTSEGMLVGMTYERDIESLKAGWHKHIFGGASDAAGSDAIVESVAVIPSPDGTSEDVWCVVKRYINGAVHRYVEFLMPIFDDTTDQKDAFFVDSGLTYDNPRTITAITKANPAVVTYSGSDIFANGDIIKIFDVVGMEEVNDRKFTVANVNTGANTFELSGINSSAYGTYVSGGEAHELVSSVSGLFHLEGQTVDVLADGAVLPSQVVSGGIVTVTVASAIIHIGLGYDSDGQLLRLDAGAADGTSFGKTRRTHRIGMMLHRSLGLKLGMDFDNLSPVIFRTSSDPGSRAPSLFSGIISESLDADYDFENQVCWRQDQPLPSMILAVMPQMVTQDRG